MDLGGYIGTIVPTLLGHSNCSTHCAHLIPIMHCNRNNAIIIINNSHTLRILILQWKTLRCTKAKSPAQVGTESGMEPIQKPAPDWLFPPGSICPPVTVGSSPRMIMLISRTSTESAIWLPFLGDRSVPCLSLSVPLCKGG